MINKVILVGRIGKNPETTALRDRSKVARVDIATSETYVDREGARKESVEWHNLAFWGNLEVIAMKYLAKGKLVYIEGKLRHYNYEDKEGRKQHRSEINVERLRMLEKSESLSRKPEVSPEPSFNPGDDLPF